MNHKKFKIEIVDMNILLAYNYKNSDITNHICKLCKKHLMAPIINSKDDINDICVKGKCGHLFHKLCIEDYKKLGNIVCPIDLSPWNTDHEVNKLNTFKQSVIMNKKKYTQGI